MRTAATVALAAALLLSGCGSDGGSSSATSGQARAGGEASIEGFGSEARGSQRRELLGAFHAYLEAIGAEEPARACSGLAAKVKHSVQRLVAGRSGPVACAVGLARLLTPSAPAVARQQAGGQVIKVRMAGGRAFLVFRAPGARLYQQTMVRENADWKLATVVASVLVPAAGTLGR